MQALTTVGKMTFPVEICGVIPKSRSCFLGKPSKFHDLGMLGETHIPLWRHFPASHFSPISASSSSVGNLDHIEEPETKVKFLKSLNIPGCSTPLSLIGKGYREKMFAFIGVKIYAAGLYTNPSILKELSSREGNSSSEALEDSSLFTSLYQSSLEKSLQIALVLDIEGKTFWNTLNAVVSSKLKTKDLADQSTIATFKGIFEGRQLKKGTLIYLTWLEPSKMLVSVSSDGKPAGLDSQLTSLNFNKALFDVFFGDSPVSPSLKDSVLSSLTNDPN